MAAAAATLVAAVAASSASAAPPANVEQWIDGSIGYAYGTSCLGPIGGTTYETQVGGYTGYWGKPDTSYPKIGDRFWGHVYYQSTGLGCGLGLHGVQVEIALPQGTSLAIDPSSQDASDKIRCFGTSNGSSYNLTDQPWQHPSNPSIKGKYCQPTVTSPGANGTILSYALVAQGQTLEIIFPLRATKKLSGIAEPNNASRMTATLTDSAANSPTQPYQWNFVGDRPVEADCPGAGTTAASAITNTTAHTKNFMCNWYRTGKAQIEVGEGASGPYQASSPQYDVGGAFQGFYIDQDWNNLTPGTVYHWRLKFIDTKGTPSTGDDQIYNGPDKTFTTTGVKPPGPSTTPGAGTGGTSDGGQMGGGGAMPGADQPQQQPPANQPNQPQQQQPPPDTTAPGLTTSVGKLKLGLLLTKGLSATAVCSEACTVQARLEIDAKTAKKLKLGKKVVVIGTGGAMAPGAGSITVPVKLTAKAKKALKRAKSLKVTLVVIATDPAGNASQPVKKTLTLKR
jgi:hypothetical protein